MLASAISNTLGASDFDSLQNPGARIISMLNIRNTSTAWRVVLPPSTNESPTYFPTRAGKRF
jgi:hypothetical protein